MGGEGRGNCDYWTRTVYTYIYCTCSLSDTLLFSQDWFDKFEFLQFEVCTCWCCSVLNWFLVFWYITWSTRANDIIRLTLAQSGTTNTCTYAELWAHVLCIPPSHSVNDCHTRSCWTSCIPWTVLSGSTNNEVFMCVLITNSQHTSGHTGRYKPGVRTGPDWTMNWMKDLIFGLDRRTYELASFPGLPTLWFLFAYSFMPLECW